jgi:hypothetical protein
LLEIVSLPDDLIDDADGLELVRIDALGNGKVLTVNWELLRLMCLIVVPVRQTI